MSKNPSSTYGDARDNYLTLLSISGKFQNLKIIWTPGSNIALPDILSRNVTIDEYQYHQLQDKKLPRDIQFFDEHGQQITYKIKNDDTAAETCNDFYPILCQQGKHQ